MHNDNSQIMVSICCITYQHEKYIQNALDGFLMQKTNFKFEILIHDDASTDDTVNIINHYQTLYPDIIIPVFQSVNQYSQGKRISAEFLYPLAKGKYIAVCEGDDFWTDDSKLQYQIDFLEDHPEYIGITHNVNILNELDNEINCDKQLYGEKVDSIYTLKDFIDGRCVAGQFCSFVFKNFFTKKILEKVRLKDFPGTNHIELSFWLVIQGDVYYSGRVMATHRFIKKRGSCNWTSQALTKNQFGYLYDLFPRLEKMAIDEFGKKVNLNKCKEAHFSQMVRRYLKTLKRSDLRVLFETWKKTGFCIKYLYLIFYTPIFDIAFLVWKKLKLITKYC